MERRARWKDHVKTTPYISPLQTFSSSGIYQEARQKTFQCPVCLVRYLEQEERPEILPCDHIICFLCYKNIKDQVVNHCPICQVQHQFIRKGISLDSDSNVSSHNESIYGSSQSLDISDISLEMQRGETDNLLETNQCHDHSLEKLDLYCNIHDIRISSECEHDKHISHDCTFISCEQEMKGRKQKAGISIDSKVHLMGKLNYRITEFLDTLNKEDPRNSPDVEDQIRAVHGLLEEVKVKQIFLSDAKREIEQQETWENILSACENAELKILYVDNSLKDMYTKLEAIKLHYSVRQQIEYGETPINNNYEKLEQEEMESSSKSKSKATENSGNAEKFPCSIQKSEHQLTKDEINANTAAQPDRTDGSMSKLKHKKLSQMLQEKDDPNNKTNRYPSYHLISLTDNAIEQVAFREDSKYKVNDGDKEPTIKEYEPDDLSQKADCFGNMTPITNENIVESLQKELNPEKKYKPVYHDNHNFQEAINIKSIVDNKYVNSEVFGEDVNLSKSKHGINNAAYDTEKDDLNNKTNHYPSYHLISLTDNSIEQVAFRDDSKSKVNDREKQPTIKDDLSQKADGFENMTHTTNENIVEYLQNELDPEKKQLYNDNHNFHEAINIKYIVDNKYVQSEVFGEDVNLSKTKHVINNTTYDTDKNLIKGTKGIDSKTLLKKLLSDTKKQKDIKISEVNRLTICLFFMFILSYIFYFMFARANNIIKDDLSNALSQKEELENLIADSLSEINILQQKLDETISQRDFFHLKLNEALIMQGRTSEIQELPQITNNESSWYNWIGLPFYNLFYFTFRILLLTGSFVILSIASEKLNEDYLSLIITTDNINKSISMVVCFLMFYEVCGLVTWVTNLPLVASPLFNWYQEGNLFIVGGLRMSFHWMFAYSGIMKWLSTAMVGIIVLALSVYIMSEISKTMKSRGVDKQNHDAFFIISWPILAFAFSVFLVWLSVLPLK